MISVEKRLNAGFDTLPAIGGLKPTYKWGNQYHLLKQLELLQKNNKSPYPLIYQTSNRSTQDSKARTVTTDLTLVLAMRETKTDLLNENRWAMSYGQVLYPLASHIETLFTKGGIFLWDGQYTLEEFPNYGSGTENFTIDKWDALRFETTITIYDETHCLKTFKY